MPISSTQFLILLVVARFLHVVRLLCIQQKQKRQKISLLIRYACAVVGKKFYKFCPADEGGTFDEVTIGVAALVEAG